MKLATRLLLLVCLAVAPAVGVLAYNDFDLRQARAAELRTQAEQFANRAAAEARFAAEEVRRLSILAAKLPDVRAATSLTGIAPTCPDLLASLGYDYPGQLEFGITNKDGLAVCTTGGPALATAFQGTEAKRAMEANGFVVGSYGQSRASNARYLTFAYPVRDDAGRAVGAVLAGLDLRWLADRMRPFVGPERSVLSVHDRDVVFLARVPDDGGLIGTQPPPAVRALSRLANTGAMEATGADGQRRVGAIVTLHLSQDRSEAPDLHVAFGLSRDAAFEPINAATRRNVALLLLSLVLAAVAAWYGGRHFVRGPIERLLAAAGRWREGELSARVQLKDRSSEFGQLAAAYEEMADTLGRRNMQREKAEQELRSSEERLRLAQGAGGIGLWDWNIPTGTVIWSDSYRRIWRLAPEIVPSFSAFLDHVHPQDRSRAKQEIKAVLSGEHSLDIELRARDEGGEARWVAIKGEVIFDNASARPVRMIGICQDVTYRKRAEDHQRLLINELNHRVKNTLATVQSVAAQTLKNSADPEQAQETFEARLLALSRTHDVLTRENWESASILEMVAEAIAPFSHAGAASRFRIEGPALRLPPGVVLPISMALHELCTNAAKYGALSNDAGHVWIKWEVTRPEQAFLLIRWVESGGPAVRQPSRRGFGSRLIERGLARQVGGAVELRFEPGGVVCTIDLPLDSEATGYTGVSSRRGLYIVQ